MAAPHLSGYQARDWEVIDYHLYDLPDTGLSFRGPPPGDLAAGRYFSCIGAAQTFGCFCEQPFPGLLSRKLGLPSLNLGYGGAGPEFFAQQAALLPYLNRSKFVIVQVMSGRSQSNSLFATDGLEFLRRRSDQKRLGANQAYAELLAGPHLLHRWLPPGVARRLARLFTGTQVRQVVAETRQAWIENYRRLLAQIRPPKILLWFSKREPEYPERLSSVNGLFGEFPQLVNRAMVSAVREVCDGYVECVTSRGSPQPLVSRFTGLPVTVDPARDRPDLVGGAAWTHNRYYPSPEMHLDAAAALHDSCRPYVGSFTA